MAIRWYHGKFGLDGRRVRLPTAAGCAGLWLRLDRDIPYPVAQVRSVTLLAEGGRLWLDVTAELPVTAYPAGAERDPQQVAGVDLGIIHPYAVAAPDGHAGRRHNLRLRQWQIGRLMAILTDKATLAGITVQFVDERAPPRRPARPAGER